MYSDLTNHQKFLLHLDRSQDALFVVARHLYRQGFSLKLFGLKKAPSAAENYKYRDNGDIYISKDEKFWQRVEVKGLSADFTCKEDWPYKDKFIVCAKHSYDNADPKPFLYYHLNRQKTHAAIIEGRTSVLWSVEKKVDSRYKNVAQHCYLCPLSVIKWHKL